ncbi:MAG: hypothetical protein ACM3X6_05570 [Patescibacteria group bacterium]
MNLETIGVLIFVFVVFGLFYYASVKADKWVKDSYAEKRRAQEAQAAARSGKRQAARPS